jgi:flagellar M-ring protein FliF
VIEPAGHIRRITAAVLVDDAIERKQEKGNWVEVHHKRQPQDLKLITELAEAAIGFDSARGDLISVQNLTFDRGEEGDLPPSGFAERVRKSLNDYSSILRYALLLVLFLLVYMLMIRPIQKRALAASNPLLVAPAPVHDESEIRTLAEAGAVLAQRSLILKKQVADCVRDEPESGTTVVHAWLREEAP